MLWDLLSPKVAKLALREAPGDFARLYKLHGLEGGHLIKLGPGNDEAAKDALRAWPGQLWTCGCLVMDHESMVQVDYRSVAE